jgi:large subunit ribosomal protein L31
MTPRFSASATKGLIMKEGIHPNYREVVFVDMSNDFSFVTRSTVNTRETIKWKDGKEYPLYKLDTSSESHPFYTGTQKLMDTAGRVEKFRQKFGAKRGSAATKS